jgi:hypothetical protein
MSTLDDMIVVVAEIVYEHSMEAEGWEDYKTWDDLSPDVQEDYLKVAEDIIETLQEELELDL